MSRTAATRAETLAGSRPLASKLRAFERYFARVLPAAATTPRRLHAAMRYGALSPGKRLRPLLVLTACEAVGGDWRRALPAAAAVECAHAFSLIHDDLPAMDDDDYRRGRLTTHKRYGEALGILAGDALLAFAFELLGAMPGRNGRAGESALVLARACGSQELVGGQVLDIEAEGRRVTGRQVRDIHLRKTGALIAASLELGAIAGGAIAVARRRLRAAGRDLGLAFQIHDDLMNRGSTLRRLGKRAGTDDARRKATYPRAVGEARARAEAERLLSVVERKLEIFPAASALRDVVRAVARRTS